MSTGGYISPAIQNEKLWAHSNGGLYIPAQSTSLQYAVYRLDPVTNVVSAVTTPQASIGFECIAVMRGFTGCPTPVRSTTWGELKARYH